MREFVCGSFLFLVLAPFFPGQPPLVDPPWIKDVLGARVFYKIAGMEGAKVRKDVVYKTVPGIELKADFYVPRRRGAKRSKGLPAVVLIHGGLLPPNLRTKPKEWGSFVSFGRLAAASGFVGVTFNTRFHNWANLSEPQSDVNDLIAYLRANSERLGIDKDRITLWAFSAGGLLLTEPIRRPPAHIKCLVAYYPAFRPRDLGSRVPGTISDETLNQFSAVAALGDQKLPPTLVARAGLDTDLNRGVDAFIQAALAKNAFIEILNHPAGRHAFDVLDDNDRTGEIVKRTLEFIKTHG